jgi:hypothetical protein
LYGIEDLGIWMDRNVMSGEGIEDLNMVRWEEMEAVVVICV